MPVCSREDDPSQYGETWRDREINAVTLIEAAAELDVVPATLRQVAGQNETGSARPTALGGRLRIQHLGRDWLIPRDALLDEIERRRAARR